MDTETEPPTIICRTKRSWCEERPPTESESLLMAQRPHRGTKGWNIEHQLKLLLVLRALPDNR